MNEVSSTTIDPINHNYPKMELPEFSNLTGISLTPMFSDQSSNMNQYLDEPATVQPLMSVESDSLWGSQIEGNDRNRKEKIPFSVTNQNKLGGNPNSRKGKSRLLVNMLNKLRIILFVNVFIHDD